LYVASRDHGDDLLHDLTLKEVDGAIGRNNLLGELEVTSLQRVDRLVELMLGETTHLCNLFVQERELLVVDLEGMLVHFAARATIGLRIWSTATASATKALIYRRSISTCDQSKRRGTQVNAGFGSEQDRSLALRFYTARVTSTLVAKAQTSHRCHPIGSVSP
jgi:hypothetical protein